MEIIEGLMQFGLTRQEAQIYQILHTEGLLTGYEVAKCSGISRSNCYTTLKTLVDKGAAMISEDTAMRYTAVPIEEFCKKKMGRLLEIQEVLIQKMPKSKEVMEGYITLTGYEHILDQVIYMILEAQYRVYIALESKKLIPIIKALKQASEKGLKVVVITEQPFEAENIVFYQTQNNLETSKTDLHQIRLIVDSSAVLMGDLAEEGSCLYSKKKNLVNFFKQTLKNEIRLIELKEL